MDALKKQKKQKKGMKKRYLRRFRETLLKRFPNIHTVKQSKKGKKKKKGKQLFAAVLAAKRGYLRRLPSASKRLSTRKNKAKNENKKRLFVTVNVTPEKDLLEVAT